MCCAVGSKYKKLVQQYLLAEMTTGLEELLDNASQIIEEELGDKKVIDQSGWSEDGCRTLARKAASSFLQPAEVCLEKIKTLLV